MAGAILPLAAQGVSKDKLTLCLRVFSAAVLSIENRAKNH